MIGLTVVVATVRINFPFAYAERRGGAPDTNL